MSDIKHNRYIPDVIDDYSGVKEHGFPNYTPSMTGQVMQYNQWISRQTAELRAFENAESAELANKHIEALRKLENHKRALAAKIKGSEIDDIQKIMDDNRAGKYHFDKRNDIDGDGNADYVSVDTDGDDITDKVVWSGGFDGQKAALKAMEERVTVHGFEIDDPPRSGSSVQAGHEYSILDEIADRYREQYKELYRIKDSGSDGNDGGSPPVPRSNPRRSGSDDDTPSVIDRGVSNGVRSPSDPDYNYNRESNTFSSPPGGDAYSGDSTYGDADGRPIILDLDGDGVEVAFGGGTFFDMDEDGYLEPTDWAAADDGFLVIDLNADGSQGRGDGVIDQARELSFGLWTEADDTDLEALARGKDQDGVPFDSNGDGVLNAQDKMWGAFRVWQDLDQDGETDQGELRSLAELGISQLSLSYDNGAGFGDESDDVSVLGNTLHGFASYVLAGTTIKGGVGDVSLRYNPLGWRKVETEGGYALEFENGVRLDYGAMAKRVLAGLDLTAADLDGAEGDGRDNELSAVGHDRSVSISGGAGSDSITGGWGNDRLSGDEGADRLRGGGGDDLVFFDADDIEVDGGGGYDVAVATEWDITDAHGRVTREGTAVTLDLGQNGFEGAIGGDGDDRLFVSETFQSSVTLHGKGGIDRLSGGAGDDWLSGDEGADILSGNGGDDVMVGGAGNDTVEGGAGDDFILGGDGDDRLYGGDDDDFMLGGTGVDRMEGGAGDDVIDGGKGVDTIEGGEGDDLLAGGLHTDHLTGGAGDDLVSGGGGDDVLVDGRGDDHYYGGAGDDRLVVDKFRSNGKDVYFGGEGFDRLTLSGRRADWSITKRGNGSFEIRRTGGKKYDHTIITQDVEQVVFTGGANKYLSPANPNRDRAEDHERSGVHNQVVMLDKGERFRDYNLKQGDDYAEVEHRKNLRDKVDGGSGSDVLKTKNGADRLTGSSGDDWLYGGQRSDKLEGGSGGDRLYGGDGGDILNGGSGRDHIFGGAGADTISGGSGADQVDGGPGGDVIEGQSGADVLYGGQGDDTIDGHGGRDRLFGGPGKDILDGGPGNDHVTGDDGYPIEVMSRLFEVLSVGAGPLKGTMARVREMQDGRYDYTDLINHYLATSYGHSARGDTFAGTAVLKVTNDEISATPARFLSDLLPRLLGRPPTGTETAYWKRQLENGQTYAGVMLAMIHEGLVSPGAISLIHRQVGQSIQEYDDVIDGGDGNDTLSGNLGDDVILGGDGADRIAGDGGDDILFGGAGADTLMGGYGDDDLYGGEGADLLVGGMGADTLQGGRADGVDGSPFDRISYAGSPAGVTVDLARGTGSGGHAEGDTIGGVERVTGSSYADWLYGDDGANVLEGGAGPDRLFGLGGSDHLSGGRGNDILKGGTGADHLDGGEGDDTVEGEDGDDHLTGGLGTDTLIGGPGADELEGGPGSDRLVGGTNEGVDDSLHDRISYAHSDGGVEIDLEIGFASGGHADGDRLSAVEEVVGSAFDDTLTGDEQNNLLIGGGGDDHLKGGTGDDHLDGGEGDDTVEGEDGDDHLTGGLGTDTLIGGPGADELEGGPGSDRLVGGTNEGVDDSLHDRISYAHSDGGVEIDLEIGFAGGGHADGDRLSAVEEVVGSAFDDTLTGDEQNNLLIGGGGDDHLKGGGGADVLTGGDGDDILKGGKGRDELTGGPDNDIVIGGEGEDRLLGQAGADFLHGGDQDDYLSGGQGADKLFGDAGSDILTGGRGADMFYFHKNDGIDRITDFQTGIDKLLLDGDHFDFKDLKIKTGEGGTTVTYQHDQDGNPVGQIHLSGVDAQQIDINSFEFF